LLHSIRQIVHAAHLRRAHQKFDGTPEICLRVFIEEECCVAGQRIFVPGFREQTENGQCVGEYPDAALGGSGCGCDRGGGLVAFADLCK
jgi:hypothetical protein